jgi:catechol 2,3-dioxygenase-like lactoylglutathione lyase family enzyme
VLALEVVPLPVADVDRALAFYTQQVGFALDVDYHPTERFCGFADFGDPDGNTWTLQERGYRTPQQVSTSQGA